MEKWGYVYIMASKKLWVLYTWVTSNLEKRVLHTAQKLSIWMIYKKIFCT